MTSRNITVHRQNRKIRSAAPIKPEEEVGTQDGKRIRSSGRGSNIVSSMERRRVTPPEIARMQKKLRRGSRAGRLHNLRRRSLNLGR
jgi:hypothetical protein